MVCGRVAVTGVVVDLQEIVKMYVVVMDPVSNIDADIVTFRWNMKTLKNPKKIQKARKKTF